MVNETDEDIVNYWDVAAKKRASLQDKHKQDLLDLMKRRMLNLYHLISSY